MLFLESWFWVFAAIAVPTYWVCPRPLKLYWLLLACVVFHYHFAGPAGMTPIICLAILTYFAGRSIGEQRGRTLFTLTIVVVVGALVFYKYSQFFLQSALALLGANAARLPAALTTWRSPAIPLGISFFTFEFVHYLYEVRVHGREPVRSPVRFAVFAIFFPCLAAGPIKRFPEFVPQLDALANPPRALLLSGVRRVIAGLFKKVCIADLLVEYIKVFQTVPTFTGPLVVSLAVLQGFRIYYDFDGYSDIAIGLAQMLNLRVPENFYRPYWSTNLQEFWRRWHMSLSSWIRDYIYIPLGGNRARRAFNLLLAMFLCGLWHGANWNFALWGVYHGMGLAVEGGLRRWWPGLFGPGASRRIIGWAVCYSYVTYGWLIFFYPVGTVYGMTRSLLNWGRFP
jgi:alginate O-acetyltransferase complex protein AlgI